MTLIIYDIFRESWMILQDSAIFMLFGFLTAGLLKAFLPDDLVARHLGRRRFTNVLKAALFGIPIPLWSCGVIPAAAGLRQQGASKGATASFLIATPETGVDSISVTYALLDPVMTVIRPAAAFLTASLSGLFINLFEKEKDPPLIPLSKSGSTWAPGGCACGTGRQKQFSVFRKISNGLTYAFGDLLSDIGLWFLLGVAISGMISALIPANAIESYLGDGFFSMAAMLFLSIPLYVCATASTPIAAALALKGLSPGAAVVFLLAGPATNAASITVISKLLGKKATVIYLGAIVTVSLIVGILTNEIYQWMGIDITQWVSRRTESENSLISAVPAIVLMGIIFFNLVRKKWKQRKTEKHAASCC